MKKLLTALILSMLMLSGCGMFRSHHAWKEAKQENPLQIPPKLDRPSTSAALTIPPPGNTQAASTAQQSSAKTAAAPMANSTRMHLPGDVDTVYKRVGLALQHGDLGTVTGQDAAKHTYQLSIDTSPDLGSSQSFLQKHFSNLNQPGSTDASGNAGADQATATVTLKVAPAKNGGSTVRAYGDSQQAVRVIDVLRSRLGG